jgi:ankyrin repeat protein
MKRLSVLLFSFYLFSGAAFAGAQEDLFTAAAGCDLDGVKKALKDGADINALNSSNQNALATAFFCVDVTKYLIDNGCDVNGGEYPAVINAANNYSVDVLKLLLDAGADPIKPGIADPGAGIRSMIDKEKAKGRKANKAMIDAWKGMLKNLKPTEVNALQLTVQATNCVPCLKMLIDAGADVKNAEKEGNLIHRLSNFSMTQEERRKNFALGAPNLKAWGLNPPDWYSNLPNDINGTPGQMLDLLLEAGLSPNEKRPDGMTAFMAVLRLHKLELAKAMMKHGADATQESLTQVGKITVKSYPISAAAEFADVELMQMILEQKPDINVTVETKALGVTMDTDYGGNTNWGGDGYTPLIIAIMGGHTDVANLLLDAGANVKIGSNGISILKTKWAGLNCLTEIKNKTPIYWAVEQEDLALVERIGKMMEWKFNPDFTIKQYETGANWAGMKCAKFKSKQRPSFYASTVGNNKAASILAAKGL